MDNRAGKNNTMYIDGRSLKKYYCKDCPKQISAHSALRGKGRCNSCATKEKINSGYTRVAKKGVESPSWRGGKYKRKGDGYIFIRTNSTGYTLEHRLVMEKKLGRQLKSWEIVHHLNGIRDDNRETNLCVVTRKTHDLRSYTKQLQKRIQKLENKLDELGIQV